MLVVGTFDLRPGPPVIDWDLAANRHALAPNHSGAIGIVDRDRELARAVREAPLPEWLARPILRVAGRFDGPAALRTTYAGLPERADPDAFARSVGETLSRSEVDALVLAASPSESARYPRSYFAPLLADPSLALRSSRTVGTPPVLQLEEYRVAKASALAAGPQARRRAVGGSTDPSAPRLSHAPPAVAEAAQAGGNRAAPP